MTGRIEKRSRPGIMRKFVITELSGVDLPAQDAARAVIMKRASGESAPAKGLPGLKDPEPGEGRDWADRKVKALARLDELTKARMEEEGEDYATAYTAVLSDQPGLYAVTC